MSACARAEPKAPSAPVAATISKTDDSTFCLADEHSSLEKHGEADPLPALDRRFLKAHTRARAEECRRLESERLVIRFSFGQLEARWHGEPLLGGKVDVLPSEYHAVKNASHAVFLAGLLFDDHSKEAPVHVADAVASLDDAIRHLHDGSSESAKRIPASLLPAQERLLVETRTAIAAFGKGELDAAAQKAFFAKVRPDVLANLRTVSGALVRGLDATVKRVRAAVEEKDPKAWDGLVVLVTVSHQARAREIGVQYFERLLGEQAGEGARNERRLIVSEGLGKAPQQYGLLVAHIVDQVGSQRVFDDPLRLQWDVLADDGGALDELFRR
ncbi:MAG TPA: hypothetical protein VM925_18955 [Labilithrix sp.]|nr:hypothetical protein [Labilithrix sp.]